MNSNRIEIELVTGGSGYEEVDGRIYEIGEGDITIMMPDEVHSFVSTFQYNNAYAVSVPKTAGNPTRTGLLTEAYQMLSHTTVLPAYYEYTLTFRNARDTDSGEMLDIIFGSRNFDISLAFNSTTGMQGFLQDAGKAETFNYSSAEAARKKVVTKSIEKILKDINEG